MRRPAAAVFAAVVAAVMSSGASAQVLRVGSYKGVAGQFSTIQAAVDAAKRGDWVLVGPGDYHAQADHRANRGPQPADTPGGVVISTSGLYLRGMDRNKVVVDGTKPGTRKCSPNKADQDFGPSGSDGSALGRNGVLVWKAANVSVQNMTACNFLAGSGKGGNEFWWNGGDGTGMVGGYGFNGSYLNAMSFYYDSSTPGTAAQYGIFSSNWSGGTWDQTYASNFNDSGYYIGACQQICNQTVNHAHGQFSALGYSGSNSGGQLVIKNSEFDQNKEGFDTNSQNGDDPSPQDGSCPNGGTSPITHTHSCWVFMHNSVHDNNNPNVPSLGLAAGGPVGTGMSVSGGRNDTIMNNTFEHNGAWGMIMVPFPDSSGAPCVGGANTGAVCLFDDWGNALLGNTFGANGFFNNDTNGDIGEVTVTSAPSNCFSGNTEQGGGQVTSSPAGLQQSKSTCGGIVPMDPNPTMVSQVGCDSGLSVVTGLSVPCLPGENYPRRSNVVMHPLPANLQTMPHPCAKVPSNPWCGGQVTRSRGCVGGSVIKAQLAVALRERLVSVAVRIGNHARHTYVVHGRKAKVKIPLGKHPARRIVIHFVEHIKVGSHAESINFTRIYRHC